MQSPPLTRILVTLCMTEIISYGVLYYAFAVLAPTILLRAGRHYDLLMVGSMRESDDGFPWRFRSYSRPNDPELGFVAAASVMVARSLLLWLLVPLGFLAWVIGLVWFLRKHVSLGQFLGWLDLNLVIALLHGLPRRLAPEGRYHWVPFAGMRTAHRIGLLDLY